MPYTIIDVYSSFIEQAKLLDSDRQALKEKRGFTDQTIDNLKFRSACDENRDVISKLESVYGRSLLKDAAILNEKGEPSSQLLQQNIIIPYLMDDGRTYFIRPHKYGLKGKGVEIYSEGILKLMNVQDNEKLIITESEFKAAACWQIGYPALGIPGISSFSKTHFPRIKEILQKNNIKSVCIIFDREVKNDPNLPNYKQDPTKRWDTQFYAWLMATQIKDEGFPAMVAELPERFMVNGKADFDGALAQGMNLEDVQDVVRSAKEPDEYFEQLTDDAKLILRKKRKAWHFENTVKEEMNCYVVTVRNGDTFERRKVSNFVIRIKNCYFDGDTATREVYFINEFAEVSGVFKLDPSEMVSVVEFETFCKRKGNYDWRGTKTNLNDIWAWEISKSASAMITMPDHVGKIDDKEHDIWLYDGAAVIDGEFIQADETGIIRHKDVSLKARSVSTSKDEVSILIPHISNQPYDYKSKVEQIVKNFNGNQAIKICVGWIVANFFIEELNKKFRSFPFLFLVGRRMSGKTTLARWLTHFAGVRASGKSITGTTQVGIARYLAYYSSLPVWLDEYRNEQKTHNKDSFLRNVYDRQGSGKGTKVGTGTREEIIRGSILLSGEETPLDNALLTRSLIIRLHKRGDPSENSTYFEMQAEMPMFSRLAYDVLTNRANLSEKYMKLVKECMDYLCTEHKLDHRIALNYAIAGCGYMLMFGESEEFVEFLSEHAAQDKAQKDEEQVVNTFFGILGSLNAKGVFGKEYYEHDSITNEIHIYFEGSYNLWAPEYQKITGHTPFKKDAIRNYLREESYYKDDKRRYIDKVLRRCMTFKADELPVEAHFMFNSEYK